MRESSFRKTGFPVEGVEFEFERWLNKADDLADDVLSPPRGHPAGQGNGKAERTRWRAGSVVMALPNSKLKIVNTKFQIGNR